VVRSEGWVAKLEELLLSEGRVAKFEGCGWLSQRDGG